MATYHYTAKDRSGKSVNGVIDAPDEKALSANLRKQGLIIIAIRQQKKKEAGEKKIFDFARVSEVGAYASSR